MRAKPERSLASEPLKQLHGRNFMMANTTNPEDSVEGTEIYSTEAVEDALLEESALENSDSLLSVLTNLNQNMDCLGDSLSRPSFGLFLE